MKPVRRARRCHKPGIPPVISPWRKSALVVFLLVGCAQTADLGDGLLRLLQVSTGIYFQCNTGDPSSVPRVLLSVPVCDPFFSFSVISIKTDIPDGSALKKTGSGRIKKAALVIQVQPLIL